MSPNPATSQETARTMLEPKGLAVRVGINVGPVNAGVVGNIKQAWTIVGTTMNTAARLESTCPPGGIQLADAAFRLLPEDRRAGFESRMVQLKGIGDRITHLLHPNRNSSVRVGCTDDSAEACPPDASSRGMEGPTTPVAGHKHKLHNAHPSAATLGPNHTSTTLSPNGDALWAHAAPHAVGGTVPDRQLFNEAHRGMSSGHHSTRGPIQSAVHSGNRSASRISRKDARETKDEEDQLATGESLGGQMSRLGRNAVHPGGGWGEREAGGSVRERRFQPEGGEDV